jgi:hypothetical protein
MIIIIIIIIVISRVLFIYLFIRLNLVTKWTRCVIHNGRAVNLISTIDIVW